MFKILCCLLLLTGCTLNLNKSSYPTDLNWNEISFDWVRDEKIQFDIGRVLAENSGYYDFRFETEKGDYSFNYTDYKGRYYNIYGRWDEDKVYIKYPIVYIAYQENDDEKEALLSLYASIENGSVISECILKADEQYFYVSIDCITGKYLVKDAETNKAFRIENDELWMNSYAYLYHFYEQVLSMEKIVSSTRSRFWQTQGLTVKEENQTERKIPADNEFWHRNPLLWYTSIAIQFENQSYNPWESIKYETPQIMEILKNIEIQSVDTLSAVTSTLQFKLFSLDFDNIIDNLPSLEVFYADNQFWIDSDFGFATFESEELKNYLLGLFDDEKATRELLQEIQEEEIIEAYLKYGLDETKTIQITEKEWIYNIIDRLSLCEYTSSITPEATLDDYIEIYIIYQQNDELKSLNLVRTSNSTAWLRYEGKFTEYICPDILQLIKEIIQ